MKNLGLFFLALVLNVGSAHACPNLSGEYAFDLEWNGKIIIQQQGCESMTITHLRKVEGCGGPDCEGNIWKFTQTLKMDGQRYEGMYDSLKPAAPDTYSFNITQFIGERVVLRNYEGELAKCDGKYSFTDFDCKLFESSYGYDESLKAFTKTQVGSWRGGDGRYENTVFTMKKIR